MPKSERTVGFRPSLWQERALARAVAATGKKPAELVGACVDRALAAVVEDLASEHSGALERFRAVLKEADAPARKKRPA